MSPKAKKENKNQMKFAKCRGKGRRRERGSVWEREGVVVLAVCVEGHGHGLWPVGLWAPTPQLHKRSGSHAPASGAALPTHSLSLACTFPPFMPCLPLLALFSPFLPCATSSACLLLLVKALTKLQTVAVQATWRGGRAGEKSPGIGGLNCWLWLVNFAVCRWHCNWLCRCRWGGHWWAEVGEGIDSGTGLLLAVGLEQGLARGLGRGLGQGLS